MPKTLTVWITTNCGKFWKRWEYQTTWPASWEICMQVRKQQLELDMEQQTGSKLGKEYVKAVYCHLVYLNYMQSIMRNARLYEASPARWTWVWVNSGSFWWTRKPGLLQAMSLQKVRHRLRLNWISPHQRQYKIWGIIYLLELPGAAGVRSCMWFSWFLPLSFSASQLSAQLLQEHFLNIPLAPKFLTQEILLGEETSMFDFSNIRMKTQYMEMNKFCNAMVFCFHEM